MEDPSILGGVPATREMDSPGNSVHNIPENNGEKSIKRKRENIHWRGKEFAGCGFLFSSFFFACVTVTVCVCFMDEISVLKESQMKEEWDRKKRSRRRHEAKKRMVVGRILRKWWQKNVEDSRKWFQWSLLCYILSFVIIMMMSWISWLTCLHSGQRETQSLLQCFSQTNRSAVSCNDSFTFNKTRKRRKNHTRTQLVFLLVSLFSLQRWVFEQTVSQCRQKEKNKIPEEKRRKHEMLMQRLYVLQGKWIWRRSHRRREREEGINERQKRFRDSGFLWCRHVTDSSERRDRNRTGLVILSSSLSKSH